MIGKTVSHYKILEKLGEGGMGVVYKAEDIKLERTVALKFLAFHTLGNEGDKARFVHEAKAAAALSHPTICTVYEIDEFQGQTFIATEYIEGRNLKDKIEVGPTKLDEAVAIAIQIAEGLQKAHEKGIVHRDIKPANVMVTSEGRAKIMDFGIAKSEQLTMRTKTGTTLGTVAYMSPEQTIGEKIDSRSDIWSMGAVLYEMVTGQRPFKGDYEQAVMYSILNATPEPATALRTGVPMELERIIDKCLEKDAAERYQIAADVVADLRRLQRVKGAGRVGARPAIPSAVASRAALRWPWVAALALMAAVVVAVLRSQFVPFEKDAGSERKMLAVLPFENLGPPGDEYFTDGVTEEVTSRLAALHGLAVISRTSAFQYKGTDKAISQIGEELGVGYILEGTVRWDRSGSGESRVRFTPRLVRVHDGIEVWSDSYDSKIDDIFEVQSQIAEQVIWQLDVTLRKQERLALGARPTVNVDAYHAYLRGLDYAGRPDYSEENGRLATQMFERAIELDPDFALAYAALSKAHSWLYHHGHDRTDKRLAQARAAADWAIKLDPKLPEAHMALGHYYYWGLREYNRALQELAIAEERLPNDTKILLPVGAILRRHGKFEAAAERFKRAFKLSPQDAVLPDEIGIAYKAMRKYADADRYFDLSISLAPDQVAAYLHKAENYWMWNGDTERALATLWGMPERSDRITAVYWHRQKLLERDYEAALEQLASTSWEILEDQKVLLPKSLLAGLTYDLMDEPELANTSYDSARALLEAEVKKRPDDHRIHSALGIAYGGLGRHREAIRAGERAVELSPISKDALIGPYRTEDLAFICVMVGEHDAALEKLERLLSIPSWLSVPLLRIDPRWDPLRNDPRFQRLLVEYSRPGT